MAMKPWRWLLVSSVFACSSSTVVSSPATDAGSAVDAGSEPDAALDAGGGTGETCVGFAENDPCGAMGLPQYGYVCFNGSPPGIAGCELASSAGALGDTYCCTENKCVAQPDQGQRMQDGSPASLSVSAGGGRRERRAAERVCRLRHGRERARKVLLLPLTQTA